MDDATEELYLQKIEEFVHDDDLIITTEFLCRKLNITIKDAKHLIAKYLADHRNVKPEELGVHYAILGRLCKGDKLCVILVSEAELSERLSLFKSGHSKEIYSIQKAINSDINALNLLNPEPRENALLGSNVSENCLASKRVVRKSVTIEPPKRKLNTAELEKTNIPVEKKPNLHENIEKKTSPTKTKIANRPVQNGKGIARLFSKMAEYPKIVDKKRPAEEKPKILEENVEKPEENEPISKQSKPHSKLIDTDNESDVEERVIAEPPKKEARDNNCKKKTPTSSRKVNKKRNRKEETPEKSQKRRKRVVEPQSDSNDDIFGKDSDEADAGHDPSSDETPQEPIVKPQKFDPSAPKNKQKKFVDKSYVDEDGYMVTKREWVAVSGSEDEEPQKEQETPNVPLSKPIAKEDKVSKKPIEVKKELPTPTAAKGKGKNAKKATNQPSILSFFNKK